MHREEDAADRVPAMARNSNLEQLLAEVNAFLASSSGELEVGLDEEQPKIFVVGALRSGTTLFTQWMAATGLFGYPSNLLSRFYGAPLIGAKIQQLLTDSRFNFRDELSDLARDISYRSENGKTKGALAPNEFWYFWRRFLPFEDLDYAPTEVLRRHEPLKELVAELNGLANIFEKPFVLKAMILSQNAELLAELFDRALVVWVHRDPVYNIQSALEARIRQYGRTDAWYSFKIKEYPHLKDLDPLSSVAGQIWAVNRALERAFRAIPEGKRLLVPYEEFCADPSGFYAALTRKLEAQSTGWEAPRYPVAAVRAFEPTNNWRIRDYTLGEARLAYERMREELDDI